jgi:uncharacterized protein YcnI
MARPRAGRRRFALPLAILAALVFCSGAWAHAEMSPSVALAKHLQLFSLAVPTEEANATTTEIELTVPQGFGIDSFVPTLGWKRQVQQTGSGENAVIQKVTWAGGHTPTGEDSVFQFLAQPNKSGTYSFQVRQTYSNGKIVDWAGSESSDAPAPTIEAKSTLGGGGTTTLTIVALVLGAIGVVLGAVALLARSGSRELA